MDSNAEIAKKPLFPLKWKFYRWFQLLHLNKLHKKLQNIEGETCIPRP